jgi:hypothetical protein
MRRNNSRGAGNSVIHFGSGSALVEPAPKPVLSLAFRRDTAGSSYEGTSFRRLAQHCSSGHRSAAVARWDL